MITLSDVLTSKNPYQKKLNKNLKYAKSWAKRGDYIKMEAFLKIAKKYSNKVKEDIDKKVDIIKYIASKNCSINNDLTSSGLIRIAGFSNNSYFIN